MQLVDVAARRIEIVHAAAQALVREARVRISQRFGKAQHQTAMAFRSGLAEVRQAGEIPEAADFPVAGDVRPDRAILAHPAQHPFVERARIVDQHRIAGGALQRADQGFEAGIIERGVAPLDGVDRIEAVAFNRFPFLVLEGRAAAGFAKLAIGAEATCASGNLCRFGQCQRAVAAPIILGARSEHDAADIQVQTHADGIGGDDVIDLAGLVERDLRIAGTGRQRAHDDRRAALLPAEEFGNRVDFLGAEGDNGGALRQLGDLRMTRIAQLRKARARLGLDA